MGADFRFFTFNLISGNTRHCEWKASSSFFSKLQVCKFPTALAANKSYCELAKLLMNVHKLLQAF